MTRLWKKKTPSSKSSGEQLSVATFDHAVRPLASRSRTVGWFNYHRTSMMSVVLASSQNSTRSI